MIRVFLQFYNKTKLKIYYHCTANLEWIQGLGR